METIVSIVGGIGLFLLGMAVMTDGLKALAGTALKTVMEKAAATPLLAAPTTVTRFPSTLIPIPLPL